MGLLFQYLTRSTAVMIFTIRITCLLHQDFRIKLLCKISPLQNSSLLNSPGDQSNAHTENDLYLGILINHLFGVLIFRGVTIHKRYVPSYVQQICLTDLFLFANTHKEFSVFYSSRRVTMVLLLLTMVCILGLYTIPIHTPPLSQECSSVLPLKDLLRT